MLRPCFDSFLEHARMVTSLCDFLSEAIPALGACCTVEENATIAKIEYDGFIRWMSEAIASGLQVLDSVAVPDGSCGAY